jgi:hypothetical protein
MVGPSNWQMSTPLNERAAKITPLAKSSEGVSTENPIALDFSNTTPMPSPFSIHSSPNTFMTSPEAMLDRMKRRSMRQSGEVLIHNIDTGEFEEAERNERALHRYKRLGDSHALNSNLDLVRTATEINPMANS